MKKYIEQYLNNIGYIKNQIKYTNIIQQQALTLFTPPSFLKNVINKLNLSELNIVKYTLFDIIKISANQLKNKQKFTNYLTQIKNKNIDFALAIIYTHYSYGELYLNLSYLNLSQKAQNDIINSCLANPQSPANCFSNVPIKNNLTVILLNKEKNKTDIQLITNLNHQLQHYFEKYAQLNNNSIERNLEILFSDVDNFLNNKKNKELINLYIQTGFLNLNDDFTKLDLFSHMFDEKEFYPMLASASNCIKWYFQNNKKSILEKLKILETMLTKKFILSKKFNQLTPNQQSSILFLYTNKCLSKNRYKICINQIIQQFKENQSHFKKSIQIINNTKDLFRKFLKKYI